MNKWATLALIIAGFLIPSIALATPIQFTGNGHYYDFIAASPTAAGLTWDQARAAATGLTYNGVSGHLATLTSSAEDQFIRDNFTSETTKFVGPWFGASWDGSAGGTTGGWSWVTGEAFSYTGWNTGEPNHLYGENAIHFSGGGWNDIGSGRTDTSGYLVEYEGAPNPVPEPATLFLMGSGLAGLMGVRRKSRA